MMIGPSEPNGPPVPMTMAEERLQQRDPELDTAAADQDRLQRLGKAMAADLVRAIARHQPDVQRAADRDQD
jgi:hypothetical protein